jgi:hypothetical protein
MPIRSSTLQKYLNQFFVETGSSNGGGIAAALQAGFAKVISIELSEKYFCICKERFKTDPRVTLILGDSAEVLWDAIKEINFPITFWLDGHWCGRDSARGKQETPLLYELEAIKKHPIKTHTILIDDLRLWRKDNLNIGFDETTLQENIKSINNSYAFLHENGYNGEQLLENDILVAKIW